jgi:NitT/TauT family transport system substrate-binding protein
MQKVRISQFGKVLAYLPLYIAQSKGYFERLGLDVTIVDAFGDHSAWDAVAKGECDFGVADPLLMVDSKQAQGVVVASMVERAMMYALSPKPQNILASIEDFSAKTIAAYGAPSTSFALMKNISRACEDRKIPGINIVEIEFTTELGYLQRKDIDAVLMTEPYASLASVNGAHMIFDGSKYFGEVLITGLFTRRDYCKAHPETVTAVVSAINEALKFLHSDHLGAARIAKNVFPETSPIAIELGTIRLIADRVFPNNSIVSEKCWYALRQIRTDSAKMPKFRDYVDNTFAVEASSSPLPMIEVLTIKPTLWGIGIDLKALWKNTREVILRRKKRKALKKSRQKKFK